MSPMLSKTRPATAVKTAMSVTLAALAVAAFTTSPAHAQDAVQWRVEDGGNGHWYAILVSNGTWQACRDLALSGGADLASITSETESSFVSQMMDGASVEKDDLRAYWLGGASTSGQLDDWEWCDGSTWSYSMWCDFAPNNSGGFLCYAPSVSCWDDYTDSEAGSYVRGALVEYSVDCNGDGIVDYGQILDGTFADDDGNGVPDPCEQPGGFDGILDVPAEYATIQEAVDAAPPGGHVLVQPGTYTGNARWVVDIEGKPITLESAAGSSVTIIDGEETRCGIRVWGTAATGTVVRGFSVRSCLADERFEDESVVALRGTLDGLIEDCHLTSNRGAAISAGGLSSSDDIPGGTFRNCVVSGNTNEDQWQHDAMINVSYGHPTFEGCSFENNNDSCILVSYLGGARLQDCVFARNEARATAYYGGIITSNGSEVDIAMCRLESNHSADGCLFGGSGISLEDTVVCVPTGDGSGFCESWEDLGGNQIGCCTPAECFGDAVQWRVDDGGNGHWYQRVTVSNGEDFDQAREFAVSIGADLASVASREEDLFIAALAGGVVGRGVIIGTRVTDPNCNMFTWTDGSAWTYENWAPSQPDCVLEEAVGYYDDGWHDLRVLDIDAAMFEWSADCNGDGLVDFGQILDGTATDCDGNFIPDECDLNDIASFTEPRTPASVTDFIEFDVSSMSDAADAVTLELSAVGDLATTSEFMFVYLDDVQLGLAFVATGAACSPVMDTFSIPAADWNAAGADGTRLIRISGVNIAPDACAEPSTSIRVVVPQPITDCDGNGIWDACDIASGDAADLDGNGVPDSCDPDCDGDGEPDGYELLSGQDLDCNGNLVPDACDLADGGTSNDVDSDGVPDECQPDCDGDGLPDTWELAEGLAMDCNANGHPDNCDIAEGTSNDIDSNGTPDECKDDCNGNGIPDYWEILKGQVEDCDGNGIPDACDIAAGNLADCDLDGRWDECAIDDGSVTDCNGNRVPDACDIAGGTDEDDNGNGTPDACEIALGDLNLDGCIDAGDLGLLIALWGISNPPFGDLNGDGTISAADLGLLIGNWTPGCP